MNPISQSGLGNFITKMTIPDAMEPIIALETTVVGGRTIQAYKRGGEDEARERFFEEIIGSIVWLFGVKVLNDFGDKLLAKILKNPNGGNFDVGTDKVLRTPFENFMKDCVGKKFSGASVAIMKGAKVLTSVILANLIIGFVVPKINHALTIKIGHQRNLEKKALMENNQDTFVVSANETADENKETAQNFKSTKSGENTNGNMTEDLAFKGGFAGLNWFTNAIENTNTGKLLSTDIGVAGGRMINARTKEERREIGIRDIGSIYFYMWAQNHVRNVLNLAECGSPDRLDPTSAEVLNKHLIQFMDKHKKGLSLEEFRKLVLGKNPNEIKLPEGIEFEEGKLSIFEKFGNLFRKNKKEPLKVIEVEKLRKHINDPNVMARIEKMSELQPKRLGKSVITKQQIIDALNVAEINNPEFLKNAFEKYTEGASSNPYKYVSNKKLYNYKKQMEEYVENICKKAKKTKTEKVTTEFIEKAKNRNILLNGVNFVAGFAVAAAFLSTIIPKVQYWVTKQKTGVDAFPGTYDYENNREIEF